MFRYFEPRDRFECSPKISSSSEIPSRVEHLESDIEPPLQSRNVPFKKEDYLKTDPNKRTQILDYHPNDQDEVRRGYFLQGPTKPKLGNYPTRVIGSKNRSFIESWYDEFDWLEYSVKGNTVYCLPCYLFYNGSNRLTFVKEGFQVWNQKQKLNSHVGKNPNSHHKNYVKRCEDLLKKNQSIEHFYTKYSVKEQDYLIRLKASFEAVKFLVKGGLAFKAHNEGENSVYKGHFREFVEALWRNSEKIKSTKKTLVRTKKHKTFRFVYRLVKLVLTLPVTTTTVERVFLGLNYVKNERKNKMVNPWLNDCLVTFVEKEVFSTIDDMNIIKRFQAMTKRRMQLP